MMQITKAFLLQKRQENALKYDTLQEKNSVFARKNIFHDYLDSLKIKMTLSDIFVNKQKALKRLKTISVFGISAVTTYTWLRNFN